MAKRPGAKKKKDIVTKFLKVICHAISSLLALRVVEYRLLLEDKNITGEEREGHEKMRDMLVNDLVAVDELYHALDEPVTSVPEKKKDEKNK